MMRSGSLLLAAAMLCGLAAFAGPARSQNTQTPPPNPANTPANNMDIVRQQIAADKKSFVAQNMQLTQAEAAAFWPVYDALQKDLSALGDRAQNDVEQYAANYKTLTDAQAASITQDYLATQVQRAQLLVSYLPKFQAVLPQKKVSRYYQLENKAYAIVMYDLVKQIPLVKY
jgi:hypothetical protein